MAGPWEKYQSSTPDASSDGPWSNYQSQQSAPQQSPPSSGGDFVSAAEAKYGLPAGLLQALVSKESSGNPDVISPKGAIGLGQVMPATAQGMGYDPEELKRNPEMQVDASARYLKQMIDQQGNIPDALAAYNWGPGNVQRLKRGENVTVPEETRNYVTDPRFAQWTQPAQPGSESELDQLAAQAQSGWAQPAPEQSFGESVEQAGKGLAQAAVNVANIPGTIVNAGLDAAGVPKEAQVMQLQLPQSMRPTDPYAQMGAEIGPYLIPGIGQARTAEALASVSNASRVERAATQIANMLAENVVGATAQSAGRGNMDEFGSDMALGLAGSAIGRGLVAGGGRVINAAREGINNVRGIAPAEAPVAAQAVDVATQAAPESQMAADYARAATTGNEGRIAQVVNDIQPDQNVIDAMRRLDINPDEMLEAYTSGSDAFKAVQIGLASQDESALAAVRRDSLSRISQRASQIIDDAGAMTDRLAMDDAFKSRFTATRNALKAQEEQLYKPVQEAIPPRMEVDPVKTRNYLDSLADDLGGYQNLSPVEKRIYESVSPTTDKAGAMTYARLNQARSIVGAELRKQGTPFGSAEERNLAQLYSQLSNDRDAVAKVAGFGEQIKLANAVTAQRKMMEENVYKLLGKDLSGNVTVKAKTALDGLQSGNTQAFTQLMRTVPDKDTRSQLIATGLRDMFRKGTRTEAENNINGFVKFYADLKRNGTDKLLKSELPAQTVREMEDFYTLARNVTSANRYYLATGKLKAFLDKFEKPGGFLDKLATHGKMATIATVLGHVPVVGPVLNTALAAQIGARAATQKSGAAAVQEMMSSKVFKDLAAAARSKPSEKAQEKIVAEAERKIEKSKAWKEFYRTLPKEEKEKIARVGIIGWLSGMTDYRQYRTNSSQASQSQPQSAL
ncbi:MAG: lytic transglycosylase domain-containing protein [Mixta calida]|uniref:lytic transglycosylase domain-containing protein n=1 Tax=Mixta calida TaxID=665913 RepID=UPI00289F144C|nr:lytic transglycosylase domain-containing protein [Mixta calida]MDU5828124.1 lytic transglycosylase domain-containing protein [Mixta calida]